MIPGGRTHGGREGGREGGRRKGGRDSLYKGLKGANVLEDSRE